MLFDPGKSHFTDFLWRESGFAQITQAASGVTFSEAFALFVAHEFYVGVCRDGVVKGTKQQDLSCGGAEKVATAYDFCDLHGRVVHYASKLVAGNAVPAHDDEVAEVASGDEGLRAEQGVLEVDFFPVGYAESPGDGLV